LKNPRIRPASAWGGLSRPPSPDGKSRPDGAPVGRDADSQRSAPAPRGEGAPQGFFNGPTVPGSRWRDACGVLGIYAPGQDVARLAYFGLFTLQHRGQEGAGIAVADGRQFRLHKGMGLVQGVFHDERQLRALQGHIAIGHVRYSTTGSHRPSNVQPLTADSADGQFAIGHNGNLVNAASLREILSNNGRQFGTTTDTELIATMISDLSRGRTLEEAISDAMPRLHGAYSVTLLTREKLIGFRDPWGVRPLCIGRMESGGYVLASETCALPVLRARLVREVQPGEIVVIDEHGITEIQAVPSPRRACCIFEFIYFARPDSLIYGKSIYIARKRMGHVLAREQPCDADIIVPVPESGVPHAIGYAEASRTPFGEALIKNRYILRTFIQPEQRERNESVRMKFSPLREAVEGRRVVLVDDSIVRGTTTRQLVGMVREAGAREVHLRINSPPLRYPCYYGIDMDTQDQFIAHRMRVPDIAQQLGADSLGYLSINGLIEAVGLSRSNFCLACFNNRYPIDIPKRTKIGKLALEPQPL
jgi:amidophosphoribosyltransferase